MSGSDRWPGLASRAYLAVIAAGLAAGGFLVTSAGSVEWRLAALCLAIGVVGLSAERLVASLLPRPLERDVLERGVLSIGLALVLTLCVAALVLLRPGAAPPWGLAAALCALIDTLGGLGLGRPGPASSLRRADVLALGPLLLLGGALRLVDLGYSDFQGDETQVLFRAAALIQGFDDALLAHRKGPAEILLAAFSGQLVGRVAEADARLPYALLSVAGIAALFVLGRELFGVRAGLIAAGLWAINGFAVAFGRIVQYESLVLLFTTLAAFCAWRALRRGSGGGAWAGLAVLQLAVAAACGFNALTLGIPALYLLARWAWISSRQIPKLAALSGLSVLLLAAAGLAVVAGPFLRDARPDLLSYAAWRLGPNRSLNNLDLLAAVTVGYTSLPYFVLTGTLGLLACCLLACGGAPVARRRALGLGLAAGFLLLILGRGAPTWLALACWGVALGGILARRDLSEAWKAAVAGFGLPLGLYAFLVARPGTHWLELYPSLLLLVGGMADRAAVRLPRRAAPYLLGVAAIIMLALAAYPAGTFLPIWPGQLVPPTIVSWYRPELPPLRSTGAFGFPHQLGWKAIARLEADGALPLPYETNEKDQVARWYLPHVESCYDQARSYVLAPVANWWGLPGPLSRPDRVRGAPGYAVTVGGQTTLVVYQRFSAGAACAGRGPP